MPVMKGPKGVAQEMRKFKTGTLHSGSPTGRVVTNPKQAIAIALSEAGMSKGKGMPRKPVMRPGTRPMTGITRRMRGGLLGS